MNERLPSRRVGSVLRQSSAGCSLLRKCCVFSQCLAQFQGLCSCQRQVWRLMRFACFLRCVGQVVEAKHDGLVCLQWRELPPGYRAERNAVFFCVHGSVCLFLCFSGGGVMSVGQLILRMDSALLQHQLRVLAPLLQTLPKRRAHRFVRKALRLVALGVQCHGSRRGAVSAARAGDFAVQVRVVGMDELIAAALRAQKRGV